ILALQVPDHLSHELAERLERLEQQMEELRASIETIQAQLRERPATTFPPAAKARPADRTEIRPPASGTGDTLPADLVSARGFAGRHGIAESTVKKAIQTGRLPAL